MLSVLADHGIQDAPRIFKEIIDEADGKILTPRNAGRNIAGLEFRSESRDPVQIIVSIDFLQPLYLICNLKLQQWPQCSPGQVKWI